MDHLDYMDYQFEEWDGFETATWCREVNVRSFIQHNYTPYDGNEEFLESVEALTKGCSAKALRLMLRICRDIADEDKKGDSH